MVDYKRKPVLWIEGTRCLTNPERGVYSDLVERMYALEADLFYDERDLAGFCNLTVRSFKKILHSLIEKGKIHITEDGKLTANHVRTECELAVNVRETYRSRGRKGGIQSGKSRHNNEIGEACGSTSLSPSPTITEKDSLPCSLRSQGKAAAGGIQEKLEDQKPDQPQPEPPPADPKSQEFDAYLFRRGKQVLGKSAGGLINRLKQAKGSSEALDIIELAATKSDAREYVGAAVKEPDKPGRIMRPAEYLTYDQLVKRAEILGEMPPEPPKRAAE